MASWPAQSIATVIVGLLSLISIALTIAFRYRHDAALEELKEAKDLRSEERSRQAVAAATVARYRDPLLGAAFELQSRLFNLKGSWFWNDPSPYPINHTLYVFAQYLGWREILRLEVQFLDLGAVEETRRLGALLENVTAAMSSSEPRLMASGFKLYRGEQRAIGEKMIITSAGGVARCLGYADFVEKMADPTFSVWFDQLRKHILDFRENPEYARLVELQHSLIELLDLLDPVSVRFPQHLRQRLEA